MALVELTWKCTKCGAIGNECTPGIDVGVCLKCQGITETNRQKEEAENYQETMDELWHFWNTGE